MKNVIKSILKLSFVFISISVLFSCADLTGVNNLDRSEQEVELAVPLINTSVNVFDFADTDAEPGSARLVIDEADRVTLIYQGDVVRQDKSAVFPSLPFFAFPLLDTINVAPVPFATDQKIDKAVFGETNISFSFTSQFDEDVSVTVEIPQLSKDGEIFQRIYNVAFDGTTPTTIITEGFLLKDWVLMSDDNIINIDYDARLADGTRVKFDAAAIAFDIIIFDYVEGYFGSDVFDINGDFIPIGVLDNWISGGLTFEDPSVDIFVENAFGFPVRSIFNKMQVETTTGALLDMESEIINNNVDFSYPTLEERGEVKVTQFSFNKDNSNIVDLFAEKVVKVAYDIDASANPNMDETIIGFVDNDSYFLVRVDVSLPLHGTVNDLVLQDQIDLDLSQLSDVNEAEFKNVISNGFPADISLQAYFYDEPGNLLDSLFSSRLELPAAPVQNNGIAGEGQEITTFTDFTSEQIDKLKDSKKLGINIRIDTGQASDGPLWIYSDYGIDMRIGAKLKTTY